MHRIFDSQLDQSVQPTAVYHAVPDEAHHALRVKRITIGEKVEILNGSGLIAVGHVAEADRKQSRLDVRISEVCEIQAVRPRITMASAVPKGSRAESMIDQLSQIGVAVFQPLNCARSVSSPRAGRQSKWERIAIESAKQCGRAHLMHIESPISLSDFAARGDALSQVLLAHQDGPAAVEVLRHVDASQPVTIVIGPEGGFTEDELDFGRQSGAQMISLGPHIMRIETAAICAASICMAQLQ